MDINEAVRLVGRQMRLDPDYARALVFPILRAEGVPSVAALGAKKPEVVMMLAEQFAETDLDAAAITEWYERNLRPAEPPKQESA